MKVICSGSPKTGTKTLAAALRILGYKVYDFEEQFFYLGDELMKVMNKTWTTEDLYRIYKDVDAVTDSPGYILWEEIFKAFPEAKIIHTERRTEEEWKRSLEKQMESMRIERLSWFLSMCTPTGRKLNEFLKATACISGSQIRTSQFSFHGINMKHAILRYRDHNSHVRASAPKDNILHLNLAGGWGPLCKFLGVAEPNVKFPHKNKEGEYTREMIEKSNVSNQIKKELNFVLMSVVVVVVVVVAMLAC